MAKSALEAVGGLNLYGKGYGTTTSTIMVMNISDPNMIRRSRSQEGFQYLLILVQVDTDAHNRNREILETLVPRESPSRQTDFATFISISFPAFALSNGNDNIANTLYLKTKRDTISNLSSVNSKISFYFHEVCNLNVNFGLNHNINIYYRQGNMGSKGFGMMDMATYWRQLVRFELFYLLFKIHTLNIIQH